MKRLVRRKGEASLDVGSPILSRLFAARGIASIDQIDHKLSRLIPPDALKGLTEAIELLENSLRQQHRILVIGDFDADGATSCALMVTGLRAMGAEHVDYLVPNRFEFGYGLTPEIVDVAHEKSPDLIITVDNGISSLSGAERAHELGIRLLITDHHLPAERLPLADAIVNPNQPGCGFASKSLAGVGVAFYVLTALRQRLRSSNWFTRNSIEEPNLAEFLDLVALGTVADVVPLDYNNRVLVHEGLRRMRAWRCRPGLLALMEIAELHVIRLTSRDLAFSLGPRLNAAGRLDDISLGIECLLAPDLPTARELARKLDRLNKERKEIESEMKTQAFDVSDNGSWLVSSDAVGVSLFHEEWHQGVIGIVAARVKDRNHRPVVAFARADGNELKGSARSIAGLHIRDAFDSIAARYPGLLIKFGGHAMAAGLSLERANLQRFAKAFDEEARRWLGADELEQRVLTDGELNEPLSISLVREIGEAVPWGQGFAEPVFDGEFEVLEQRVVGGHHLKLRLARIGFEPVIDAIAFNHPGLLEGRYQRLAYRPEINEFRGLQSVQLVIEATGLTS